MTVPAVDVPATSPQPPGRPPRRRGPGFWIGLAMVLAGLGLLGWLAWQFFGTTWVAHRDQERNVQLFERGSRLTDAEALVRIPRFGADYVMPVYAGVGTDVLARGFGHFTESAGPGRRGNYALAGHRITHGEPLRRMPELRPGDRVLVDTGTTRYVYVLDTDPNGLVVPFTQTWVLDAQPRNPRPGGAQPPIDEDRLITLTTCSELFHTDDRMIAFGHLVAKRPLQVARPLP